MSDIRVRQLCWMVLYSSYIIVPTPLIEFNDDHPPSTLQLCATQLLRRPTLYSMGNLLFLRYAACEYRGLLDNPGARSARQLLQADDIDKNLLSLESAILTRMSVCKEMRQ